MFDSHTPWARVVAERPAGLLLVLVLAVATALRVWALNSGIPYALGTDEPVIMDHVVQMMKTGRLHPPFFDYPGLVFYLQLPVACLRFLKGAMAGEWTSLDGAGAASFYLWARAFTASLGVATVFLVYRIGLRWSSGHALVAAALFAVMPLHVRESRFVLTDVPMTFFVTLALLLSLRAHEKARMSAFAWAGLAVGLGTAVKYTAGVALLVPLLAAWMTGGPRFSRLASTLVVGGGFAVGFCAGAPYTLLDLPAFLDGFARLTAAYIPRAAGDEHAASVYLKHLILNFRWPAFALILAGLATSVAHVVSGPRRLQWALVAVFPFVFVLSLGDHSPIYGRYLLPVVPFACLAAAIAIFAIAGALRRFDLRRAVPAVLTVLVALVLLPAAFASVASVRAAGAVSTQTVAYQWIAANVAPGSVLVIERGTLMFPSDLYRSVYVRRITDRTVDQYRAIGAQCLVGIPDRIAAGANRSDDQGAAYGPEVAHFTASDRRPGPDLRIIRVQ